MSLTTRVEEYFCDYDGYEQSCQCMVEAVKDVSCVVTGLLAKYTAERIMEAITIRHGGAFYPLEETIKSIRIFPESVSLPDAKTVSSLPLIRVIVSPFISPNKTSSPTTSAEKGSSSPAKKGSNFVDKRFSFKKVPLEEEEPRPKEGITSCAFREVSLDQLITDFGKERLTLCMTDGIALFGSHWPTLGDWSTIEKAYNSLTTKQQNFLSRFVLMSFQNREYAGYLILHQACILMDKVFTRYPKIAVDYPDVIANLRAVALYISIKLHAESMEGRYQDGRMETLLSAEKYCECGFILLPKNMSRQSFVEYLEQKKPFTKRWQQSFHDYSKQKKSQFMEKFQQQHTFKTEDEGLAAIFEALQPFEKELHQQKKTFAKSFLPRASSTFNQFYIELEKFSENWQLMEEFFLCLINYDFTILGAIKDVDKHFQQKKEEK